MSETMIERVARAIAESAAWDNPEDWRDIHLSMARAAIEAMREPSNDMLVAGRIGEGGRTQAEDVWEDMIDAALREDNGMGWTSQ